MSRKDTLRSLLSGEVVRNSAPAEQIQDSNYRPPAPILKIREKTGPIRNLEGELRGLLDDVATTKSMVANGEAVVEINTDLIETSFIKDRLDNIDEEQVELIESIREHGQQVPILVRPHPTETNKFQVVYGHRRLRACVALERPIKALIRPLSDIQLVVAQGQENSTRKGLSYIERAYFALRLEDRGFDRQVIMAALNLHKTHLSTLISVARRIPVKLISSIGAAPKAGGPRWIALADQLEKRGDQINLDDVLANPAIKDANSDERFVIVFNSLHSKPKSHSADVVLFNQQGLEVARVKRNERKLSVTVDQKDMLGFGQYLIDHMADFYHLYEEERLRSISNDNPPVIHNKA
jgi:ParB family chromosome partitioning protein